MPPPPPCPKINNLKEKESDAHFLFVVGRNVYDFG